MRLPVHDRFALASPVTRTDPRPEKDPQPVYRPDRLHDSFGDQDHPRAGCTAVAVQAQDGVGRARLCRGRS